MALHPRAGRCLVCGEPLGPRPRSCPSCQTFHHRDCWVYNNGCAVYGCRLRGGETLTERLKTSTAVRPTSPGTREGTATGRTRGASGLAPSTPRSPLSTLALGLMMVCGFVAGALDGSSRSGRSQRGIEAIRQWRQEQDRRMFQQMRDRNRREIEAMEQRTRTMVETFFKGLLANPRLWEGSTARPTGLLESTVASRRANLETLLGHLDDGSTTLTTLERERLQVVRTTLGAPAAPRLVTGHATVTIRLGPDGRLLMPTGPITMTVVDGSRTPDR